LREPVRDMNRFQLADRQMAARIGELLDEPPMPFVAVEVLLNPIQELIEQLRNDHSPAVIGRSRSSVRCRCGAGHQTMKSILCFAFRAFALRERDLVATQADIPSVVLTSIPGLRCTHLEPPIAFGDSATESSAVPPSGK